MLVSFHSDHVLRGTSGGWRVTSLFDGHLDMPASLLRDAEDHPALDAARAEPLRLSVNCFALERPGLDGVLIDSGGGGWSPTLGRLEESMAEAGTDPASLTLIALTHAHQDHVHGLLARDGRVLFPNLAAIAIPEAAVAGFLAEAQLARFRPLLKPIRSDDQVAGRLRAVALPGHAPGHTGYALDTGEDQILFFGDVVHAPAMQFANPALAWGYDDDQHAARATRLKVFRHAAETGMLIAGAHLGRPGIGRVTRKGGDYAFEPLAG